jgi:hypothetical protein
MVYVTKITVLYYSVETQRLFSWEEFLQQNNIQITGTLPPNFMEELLS